MNLIIGYGILLLIFGTIFIIVAKLESVLVASGIFSAAILMAVLMALAEHLIKLG